MLGMIVSRNPKAVSTEKHVYTPSPLSSVTHIFGSNLFVLMFVSVRRFNL